MTQENSRPKRASKRRIKPIVWIVIAAAVVVIAVALIFILKGALPAGQGEEMPVGQAEEETSGDFSTPVGELSFPQEFADEVEIKESSSGEEAALSFYGRVGEQQVFLFELRFGGEEGGYSLGSVSGESGERMRIWLNISEIEADPSWSEEEREHINMLQSCVNDLIEQINALDGYEAD